MSTIEILNMLQRGIHSVVFATADEKGLLQTCVIDRLTAWSFAALSGIASAFVL